MAKWEILTASLTIAFVLVLGFISVNIIELKKSDPAVSSNQADPAVQTLPATSTIALVIPDAINTAAVNAIINIATTTPVIPPAALPPPPPTPTGKPLQNPPKVIKGLYMSAWSASSAKKSANIYSSLKASEGNALVVDLKDYSGTLSYHSDSEKLKGIKTEEIKIQDIDAFVNSFHQKNVYLIARIAVFQDPALAKKRPDLAVQDSTTGVTWKDNKGLSWVDPASKEVWDYTVNIANDAYAHGFDEVNFDYIRFPSDGKLSVMTFPFYDIAKQTKASAIGDFFAYLRSELKGKKISGDIFGLTTVDRTDLGIGQLIEAAYANFDYTCPMIYPSHFANGFQGYKNPAEHPYEVVLYSMTAAVRRLNEFKKANPGKFAGELRPWLQDFDMGAVYGKAEAETQMNASEKAGVTGGWLLWDPSNNYSF